jgi:hypothetical protein
MMEITINAPLHIKKAIARKIQRSGTLQRIERKIKLGIMIAVEELRENPRQPSTLECHRFRTASPHENRGLQLVYDFLSERGLTYTLSVLLEESCVSRNSPENLSLISFLCSGDPLAVCTRQDSSL